VYATLLLKLYMGKTWFCSIEYGRLHTEGRKMTDYTTFSCPKTLDKSAILDNDEGTVMLHEILPATPRKGV